MPKLHVLKVFVGEDGTGGNPLGVFLEGHGIPAPERQGAAAGLGRRRAGVAAAGGVSLEGRGIPAPDGRGVAADLGFSETVFVDDAEGGELRIFTPGTELPFAGHPLVGTAWPLHAPRGAVRP